MSSHRRRVTRTDAYAAADRIATRRMQHHGPGLEQLPEHLHGLVAFVHIYPAQGPRPGDDEALRRADAEDAFLIVDYLRAELDRQRLALHRMGRDAGASWGQLAGMIGKPDRRHAEGEYMRLVGAVEHGMAKSDAAVRERIAAERAAGRRERQLAAQQAVEVRRLALWLLASKDDLPDLDAGYDLADLDEDMFRWQPGTPAPVKVMAGLRLLAAEARKAPGLPPGLRAELDRGWQVLTAPTQ